MRVIVIIISMVCTAVFSGALMLFAKNATPVDIGSIVGPIREKYDLPALAGAIVTSNGIAAQGVVGMRKYGTQTPVTSDDEFHLGSDTKAMTATIAWE